MREKLVFYVTKEQNNLSVREILQCNLKLTKHQISSAKFRNPGICLNDRKCRIDTKVSDGDMISVYLEEAAANKNASVSVRNEGHECLGKVKETLMDLDICYEDGDFLIVNKPAGMVIHPSHGHYEDTLANAAANYLKEECKEIHVIGRLDKDTSGLVIFAKHKIAAARLSKDKVKGSLRKTYLALVEGRMDIDDNGRERKVLDETDAVMLCGRRAHLIEIPLMRAPGELNKMMPAQNSNAKNILLAQTLYTVVHHAQDQCGMKYSVVLAEPLTGRTHQIRVHMEGIGHPLLGDPIYGAMKEGTSKERGQMKRAALHCMKVDMIHPFTEEILTFTAPLPKDMKPYVSEEIVSRSFLI